MPGTPEELVQLAVNGLPSDFPVGVRWADGTEVTDMEALDVRLLVEYRRDQIARRAKADRQRKAQRKALRLLRGYLTPTQRASLRWDGAFLATSPSGATYRVDARRGRTERVTKHGSRWYVLLRFCIHDEATDSEETMPPADLALTHLLLLHSDEGGFLKTANTAYAGDMLWNGNWLRRLRQARREREAA